MDTLITMHSLKAEFVTDKHGPIVFIKDTEDGDTVGLHPMQLRYIAERFAGLEPQPKPQPMPDPSAALVLRLLVLADHIEDLHTALLKSRASQYTDMSHELASAGALYEIARAYTSDLPEVAAAEPAQRAQACDATTTTAEASGRTGKASAAPVPAPAEQLGLDV